MQTKRVSVVGILAFLGMFAAASTSIAALRTAPQSPPPPCGRIACTEETECPTTCPLCDGFHCFAIH